MWEDFGMLFSKCSVWIIREECEEIQFSHSGKIQREMEEYIFGRNDETD